MHRYIPKNRWQAFGVHLLLSLVVATALVALMLLLWYPGAYFETMGGRQLLFLIAGVDVVLGPLITLVVYRPGKKGLKFDLAVIAALQLGALVYGGYLVFEVRPAFIVWVVDRFEGIAVQDVDRASLAKARHPEFAELSLTGPRLAAAKMPADPKIRDKIMFDALAGGPDLGNLPEYYVPYVELAGDVAKRARPLAELKAKHPGRTADIEAARARSGKPEGELGYVPLRARAGDMSVIVDKRTGKVEGMLALDPW